MSAHYVYRCYDDSGVLLYIGCTAEVARRMSAHRSNHRQWASRVLQIVMARHEVEGPFADRAAGEAAEQRAIWQERPLLNKCHTGGGYASRRHPTEQYLLERGIDPAAVGIHRCDECHLLRAIDAGPGICPDCLYLNPALADTG